MRISPLYEKAQEYLSFCLDKTAALPKQPLSTEEKSSPSQKALTRDAYTDFLLRLLEHSDVQKDQLLREALESQLGEVMSKDTPELSPEEKEKARWTQKLWGPNKKIRSVVARKLKQLANPAASAAAASSPRALQRIPAIAFGAVEWAKYFGRVDKEPRLPEDIHEILQGPCPIWENKRVEETHILFLVPKRINGKPLTLNTLGKWIKKPRGRGHATKYRYYWDRIKKELGDKSVEESHWVLMTRDVLPDTRKKSWEDQQVILRKYEGYRNVRLIEAATGIFMQYVRSGERLYPDDPCRWIRCEEVVGGWHVGTGGFSSGGLYVVCYCGGLGAARKF